MATTFVKTRSKLFYAQKVKQLLFALFVMHCSIHLLHAQNIGINSSGAAANSSAILDVTAGNKGILIPRVSLTSTTDVSTISSPATNLIVMNTNASITNGNGTGMYYYNGSKWVYLMAPSNGPGTSGEVLTSQGAGNPPIWQAASGGGGGGYPTEITNELDASGNPCSGTACGTTRTLRNCSIDCNNLNYNGNTDWRVPTAGEITNLINIAPGNTSTQPVWSLTFHN